MAYSSISSSSISSSNVTGDDDDEGVNPKIVHRVAPHRQVRVRSFGQQLLAADGSDIKAAAAVGGLTDYLSVEPADGPPEENDCMSTPPSATSSGAARRVVSGEIQPKEEHDVSGWKDAGLTTAAAAAASSCSLRRLTN